MTKDLEDTLAELGPGYREVVDRLSGAYRPLPQVTAAAVRREAAAAAARVLRHRRARASGLGVACLAAASLLVFLGLAAVFAVRPAPARSDSRMIYTVAYAPTAEALESIVSSQRADGSWANDFITQQNAAALRGAAGAGVRTAYKKAVRYLRSKGLRPLSEAELHRRGDAAARCLAKLS